MNRQEPVSARLRQRLVSVYRVAATVVAVLSVSTLCVDGYSIWSLYCNQINAETAHRQDLTNQILSGINATVSQLVALTGAVVADLSVTSSTDSLSDLLNITTSRISEKQARTLSYYDQVSTWLASETGPPEPIPSLGAGPKALPIFRITRGLPIRAPNGRRLAPSHRALFDSLCKAIPTINSIAELDNMGRILVMVPYRRQISLTSFDFSGRLKDNLPKTDGTVRIIESPFDPSEGEISFFASGTRSSGRFYILLTISAASTLPPLHILDSSKISVASQQSSTNINVTNQLPGLACKSSSATSAAGFARFLLGTCHPLETIEGSSTISGCQYSLLLSSRIMESPEPFRYAILLLAFFPLLFSVFVGWQLTYSFRSRSRLQAELRKLGQDRIGDLARVRFYVDFEAKDIAHSFTNSLVSLRVTSDAIEGVEGKSDRDVTVLEDVWKQLGNSIKDFRAFTQRLSRDLTSSAFLNAKIVGEKPKLTKDDSTYLKETLDHTIGQYKTVFKTIGKRFEPEFEVTEPFVKLSFATLTSTLQNLLRNSRQAGADKVTISIKRDGSNAVIHVEDNGGGIPDHLFANIFGGVTSNGDGHGYGLLGCKINLEKEFGSISLVSSRKGQTIFEIRARLDPAPVRIVNRVRLREDSVIVVVDDEDRVARFWQSHLTKSYRDSLPPERLPKIINLSSPEQLRADDQGSLSTGTLFLIDYEFSNHADVNGIQLIEELGLKDRSILVTGYTDREDIVKQVAKKGIQLLSKTYMYSVGFRIAIGGEDE